MKLGISWLCGLTGIVLAAFFPIAPYAEAQIITGAPAVDGLGQYDQTSFTDPVFKFNKTSSNDGPGKLGFYYPSDIAIDRVHHRMFVVDSASNRVLVFGLSNQDRPDSRFPQAVLGQPDFASEAAGSGAAGLNQPLSAAYSPTRDLLFVADNQNNRVVVYDVATITDGESAVYVLGQPNFSTTASTVTATGIGDPQGIALDDAGGRLFVSMIAGSRVLVFDINTITSGEAAVNVLGRSDFTSSDPVVSPDNLNFNAPRRLAFNASHNRLFVADSQFRRVMVFDVAAVFNNENATEVICQANFTSQASSAAATGCSSPRDVAYDDTNDRLYVVDGGSHRVTMYSPAGPGDISNGMSANAILGQLAAPANTSGTSQSRLSAPAGISLGDDTTLFVADTSNNRIMVFDVATATTHENAIDMLGQYDESSYLSPVVSYTKSGISNSPNRLGFGSTSPAVAIDSARKRLFVADSGNHRVLVYNLDAQNKLLSKVPVAVLGQPDFASRAQSITQSGMNSPEAVAYDSATDRLFVADANHNRVLVFDTAAVTNGENAAFVLGQSIFTTNALGLSQSAMNSPGGLAVDEANQRLFVADSSNRRVTVFDIASISNGENAVAVLGQPDFTSDNAVVSATGLSFSSALAYDADNQKLFVADSSANRVVRYDVAAITNGEAADAVLCQSAFTTNNTGTTAGTCSSPRGVAYDSARQVLYVSDGSNNRVLAYDVASITNGEDATHVLGQTDFTSSTSGQSATKFNSPAGLTFEPTAQQLYVSPGVQSRVLIFPTRYLIEYSATTVSEATANDGTITATINITLDGPRFAASSGVLTRDVDYTMSGLPAGLTEVITRTSATTATISFTGSAAAHEGANNIAAFPLIFLDAAFDGIPAAEVSGYSVNFAMTFTDAPTPAPTPCFGGTLPKPTIKVKGKTASVRLPTAILPSAQCTVKAQGSLKKPKKSKSRAFRVGKQLTTLSKLTRGRWTFSYVVTTTALGSSQTSATKVASIK